MTTARTIFGCGYLGARVARRWSDEGDVVHAATRRPQRAGQLQREGYQTIVADATRPESLANLPAAEMMLFAVGFDRNAGRDIHAVYAAGLRNVLAALPQSVSRCIYISTTGVYGDAGGGWVDEQTPVDPQRAGGRASLAAEEALRQHPLGRRSVILRLAGIYGPGRIPYLQKFRSGEPIPAPNEGWLNLIHVDDAANIVIAADRWAAAQAEATGPWIFNVSDGNPVQRGDYYREVACRLGAPAPNFATPDADSPAAARAATDRRISNRLIIEHLAANLTYPNYRAGLAAILQNTADC